MSFIGASISAATDARTRTGKSGSRSLDSTRNGTPVALTASGVTYTEASRMFGLACVLYAEIWRYNTAPAGLRSANSGL